MKNKILITIVLIFLLIFPTQAQMLIKENKIWSIASCGTEGPCIMKTKHYRIGEEIIINDTLYHRLCISDTFDPYNWSCSSITTGYREKDSIVYRRGIIDGSSIDYAIFDFSKKVGEEFFLYHNKKKFIIDSIISRNIQGLDLKHWYANNEWGERIIFIEKIGSFYGFMVSQMALGADITVLCISEDDEIFYRDTEANSCHLGTNSAPLLPAIKGTIKLVSCLDKQVLANNENALPGTLSFYTSEGKSVAEFSVCDKETLLQLPQSGLFIYRFRSDNGQVQNGKVLVR